MSSSRVAIVGLLIAVFVAGYLLRFHLPVAEQIRDGAGGVAYVIAAALAFVCLWPRLAPRNAALAGFLATCAVEVSQLWHPAWLDAVRATRIGRLALGTTFAWGDFGPYAIGAILAWALLALLCQVPLSRRNTINRSRPEL